MKNKTHQTHLLKVVALLFLLSAMVPAAVNMAVASPIVKGGTRPPPTGG